MIPPSARYLSGYIDGTAEKHLLEQVDDADWRADLSRRVQHYGYVYDYRARTVTRDSYIGPLPDWLAGMAKRLRDEGVFERLPDQVIVNEYLPGQGIAPHVDCEPCFGDTIASLSLGSGCTMNFRDLARSATYEQRLEPCSLVVLQGESRFGWTHGIAPRKSDVYEGATIARGRRVSLTFRNVIIS